jgi:two-component system cell cycle sensor histidine kinase/response regulator CckA
MDITERKQNEEALRAQEAKYRHLVEQLPVVTYTAAMDEVGSTIFVSPQIEAVLGHPPQTWIDNPDLWSSRIHPEDRERVLAAWTEAYHTDQPFRVEYRMTAYDGSVRWFYDEARIVRDAQGKPLIMQGVMLDITQRKQVEEQLRERTASAALTTVVAQALTRHESLRPMLHDCVDAVVQHLDAAFARIWTLNASEKVLELLASAGLYTHLDGAHGRVPVGQNKIGLIAQERQPYLTNDVSNDPRVSDKEWARREGIVSFAGYPLLVGDRLVGVMAMFARSPLSRAVLDAMEAVASHIAVAIDRKRAEEELRRSEELLRRAEAIAHIAGWTLTVDDGVIVTSDEGRRLFGWGPGSHRMDDLLALVHPDDRPRVEAAMRGALAGIPFETEHRLVVTGEIKWIHRRVEPETDGQGHVVRLIGVSQDITARRQLEEQFWQAQKMDAIGTLAGGVAHDFNNLLTIINGNSDLLLSSIKPDDPMRNRLAEIHKAGERAGSLTRQLLMFSRQQVIEPKVLDLNAVVADMEKMLGRLIGEDIVLTTVLGPALAPVQVDPGQFQQVLMNLSVNARDAMPQGGRLTIETCNVTLDDTYAGTHPGVRPGGYIMLAVSDTGTGMDAPTKARIFEPFFTTKETGKGTGLGLAVVHGVVTQSEGHIDVYSEVGKGTTLKIYLPAVKERLAMGKSGHGLRLMPRGSETVLLIEDEDAVRTLARHVLSTCGYMVLEAADGREAVRVAGQHPGRIDLVVSDVVMPHLGGRQLVERLAAVKPGMKVLFVSGYTDNALVRHGVLEAEYAFLQKPFTLTALAQKVREVLDQK